jgi:hypothetical protein
MIKILVLGCNYDQIPYLKELKEKYYIIGCDLNPGAPGKTFCDKFYNVGYNDIKKLIEIGKIEGFDQNDKVFTAASQFAHLGAAHFAKEFKISYPTVQSVEICLDKVKFYKFFQENNLPIPTTNYLKNKNELIEYVNLIGTNKSYFLKSDYSKNPNYVYNFKGSDLEKINICWKNDNFFREHYILQEEFIGEHIRVNIIQKDFIIFPMKFGDKLSYTKEELLNFNIISHLRDIVSKLGLNNWIIKFDLVVNNSAFVVLDIGMDPPFRLNLYYNKLSLNFAKYYTQHYLNNIINYPVLEYEY